MILLYLLQLSYFADRNFERFGSQRVNIKTVVHRFCSLVQTSTGKNKMQAGYLGKWAELSSIHSERCCSAGQAFFYFLFCVFQGSGGLHEASVERESRATGDATVGHVTTFR